MNVLAIDLGASNGRAIVGSMDNHELKTQEIHRFENKATLKKGHLRWDLNKIVDEILYAIKKASDLGYKLESLAIDSWGVDYGLIDDDGQLAYEPICYRDERSIRGQNKLLGQIDEASLIRLTGMTSESYNTVNQFLDDDHLKGDKKYTFLNIPDLINYLLTGVMHCEYSMATTTQLYDYKNHSWHEGFIKTLPLENLKWPLVSGSMKVVGEVKETIKASLGIDSLKVVSVTSHDTALALGCLPEKQRLFVATGTWVIVGTKNDQVVINDQMIEHHLTNEGSRYPSVSLLKNHVGLWLLQECKRTWHASGEELSFSEMVGEGQKSEVVSYLDLEDERFFEPDDMPEKIRNYCQETDQAVPQTKGDVVSVIEHSIAKKISQSIKELEAAGGESYSEIFMFGGGVRDEMLCELIKFYSGKTLKLGPIEATSVSNIIEQLLTHKTIKQEEVSDLLNRYFGNPSVD